MKAFQQYVAHHLHAHISKRFLTCQIWNIVRSKNAIQKIFILTTILINLRKYCLQLNNLEMLIFVNKNWPNDHGVDCKSPHNFVELIEKDINLERNLKNWKLVWIGWNYEHIIYWKKFFLHLFQSLLFLPFLGVIVVFLK